MKNLINKLEEKYEGNEKVILAAAIGFIVGISIVNFWVSIFYQRI